MSNEIKVEVEHILRVPMLPNFIICVDPSKKIHIKDVSDEGLQKLGEQWTMLLIAKAQRARELSHDQR